VLNRRRKKGLAIYPLGRGKKEKKKQGKGFLLSATRGQVKKRKKKK